MESSKLSITLAKKPSVTIDEARTFIMENWDFIEISSLNELVSYDFRTYLVKTEKEKYIFKIANEVESQNESYFEALEDILNFLENNKISAQRLITSSKCDKKILQFSSKNLEKEEQNLHLKAFLLTYIEGELVNDKELSLELCFNVARDLQKLTSKVDEICPIPRYLTAPPGDIIWKLDNVGLIRNIIPYIQTCNQQNLLSEAVTRYEKSLHPHLGKLTKGFIHGDPNESNIIVSQSREIFFIDWQDIGHSYKIYDLAILIFSMILVKYKSLSTISIADIGSSCLEGYIDQDYHSISEYDVDFLANIIEARIATSLCVGQYTYTYVNNENEYLLTSAKSGWILLEEFLHKRGEYTNIWKTKFNMCKLKNK